MPVTPKSWWQVEVRVPVALAEDTAGLLVAHGAMGAQLLEDTVRGCFDGRVRPQSVRKAASSALGELGLAAQAATVRVRKHSGADWAQGWKKYFRPLAIGEHLWVVPSWERKFVPPPGACVVELDPGMAFGTGQHESTALTLELLEASLRATAPAIRGRQRVLDVGCGSGILAVFSAKLGAGHVVAVDNDPEAVRIARQNARANRVSDRVTASGTPLGALRGKFRWALANILAPVIVALAPELVGRLAEDGALIVSGILDHERRSVSRALRAAARARGWPDFAVARSRTRSGWAAMLLTRRGVNRKNRT